MCIRDRVNDKLFPIPVNPYTSRLASPVKFAPEPLNDVAVQTPVTRKPVETTGAPFAILFVMMLVLTLDIFLFDYLY